MSAFRIYFVAFIFVISLLFATVSVAEDSLDDLNLITENYPPFNFHKSGETKGICVDALLEALKIAGSTKTRKDIKVLPWTVGYAAAQRKVNTLLFCATRTGSREDLFKWVGPITKSSFSILARKDRHIKIESIHDLNQYKIGAVRDDVAMLLMLERGVAPGNIYDTVSETGGKNLAKMLAAGRIDLWGYSLTSALTNLRDQGYPLADYESVYTLKNSENYFVLHKDTDDKIVAQLQAAVDEMKASGKLHKIIKAYGLSPN